MIRRQYIKTSDGQGGGVSLRRVSCKNCGFPGCDLFKHDHSGGSLAGDGAGGSISLQAVSASDTGSQQEGDGNQAYNVGGGCPLCMSKAYYGSSGPDEFESSSVFHDVLI